MKDLLYAILKAHRTFICGNGGSAANATHICNDLISAGIKAHSLTADVATLTAIANDYSYTDVFSRQLQVLAEPKDLLICLSGSGNSKNIIQAIRAARFMRVVTCGIFGAYNDHSEFSNCEIIIQHGNNMQAAEEAQLVIGHKLMRALKGKK